MRSADGPVLVTPADLRRVTLRETQHAHGARGMYVYEYRCNQYPRLTRTVRRENRGASEVGTWFVDGVWVSDLPEAVAAALNRPHDLSGIVERFNARSLIGKATGVVNGFLVVRGETAERCEKLRESYPHFEGVPIDWCPALPAGALDGLRREGK